MNKEDAAKFLGVTERQVERYTKDGRLSAGWTKGTTRPVRDYAEDDLQQLKAELDSAYQPTTATTATPTTATTPTDNTDNRDGDHSTALAKLPDPRAVAIIAAVVAETLGQVEDHHQRRGVPIESKLLLTLPECQQLTGLSRATLRAAIDDGELQGRKSGKAWRVSKTALESFVAAGFDAPAPAAKDGGKKGKR